MNGNRHTICRRGRLLFCLLLAALMAAGWIAPARGEAADQPINASGSRNITPSIDPIRKGEGYSAILYNNLDGLPTSEANAIAQTGEGFIWIGSYAGLIRFDGSHFKRIDSSTGIANVRSLYTDSQDRLWVGTNDSGVFLMAGEEVQALDRPPEMRFVSVRSIAEDGANNIYIASSAGLGFYDAHLKFTALRDERIAGKTVREIRYANDGLLYGVTTNGDLFAVKGDALEGYISREECRVEEANAIYPDPKKPGYLYLGTESSNVYYGDFNRNFAAVGVKDISPLYSVESFESINGEIWICSASGVGKLDAEGFHRLKNAPIDNTFGHVMTDYEGNMWFTSSKYGVMKVVPNRFSDLFIKYDLTEAVVNTTCAAGRRLFIGTDTGLIAIEDGKRLEAMPLTRCATASGTALDATDLLELLDGIRIRCIMADSGGRLWISTMRNIGLICYEDGEATVFNVEDGLFSDRVRATIECEDGSIAAVNTGGVSVIRDGRVAEGYGAEDGITDSNTMTVAEGFDHDLILGTDGGGIFVIGPEGVRHVGVDDGLQSEVILRVKRSRARDLCWIVTSNSIAYMTPDYRVTTVERFPYSNNFDLYEASDGDVWVLSSNGIYVVPAEALLANGAIDAQFFGISSGLPYMTTTNSYSSLTANGDLYIAGVSGAIKVNIDQPFEYFSQLKIAMPYIDIDGRRAYPDDSGAFNVPRNARKVTIYPYVFSYSMADLLVSYRLEGFDTADITIDLDALGPVDYTNLREGTYSFILRVENPVEDESVTTSYRIVREKAMSDAVAGSVIMDATALLFLGGLLIYTAMYRKRGRLDDKLFFAMVIVNAVLATTEMRSYLLEGSSIPFRRALMLAENTVYYAALIIFPYLYLLYVDFRAYRDEARIRKMRLPYSIPCLVVLVILLINLYTGWIFSITRDNTYHSGPIDQYIFIPLLFYFVLALIRAYRIDPRLVYLGVLLIVVRVAWEIWYVGISSTAFIYALYLVCAHIHVMNRSLMNEEAP